MKKLLILLLLGLSSYAYAQYVELTFKDGNKLRYYAKYDSNTVWFHHCLHDGGTFSPALIYDTSYSEDTYNKACEDYDGLVSQLCATGYADRICALHKTHAILLYYVTLSLTNNDDFIEKIDWVE